MKGIWTEQRIDLLKRLWSEGKTAAAIAANFDGISRSAVLGKIFRLRLGPAAAPAQTEKAQSIQALFGRRRKGRPSAPRPDVAVATAPAPNTQRGKSLLELNNDSCRWPFGRPGTKAFHYCGATGADLENGRPYCEQHMRRAYLAPERKPKQQRRSLTSEQTSAPQTRILAPARTGQRQTPSANFRRPRL